MPEDSPAGNIAAAFDLTLQQRNFEISQLTQRNNFFMIFQGVVIAGLIQSGGVAAPILTFAVCLLGFGVSLWQTCMAAGAKFWQVRWERANRTLEIWLLEELKNHDKVFQVFTSDTDFLTQAQETKLKNMSKLGKRVNDPLEMSKGAITAWVAEDLGMEGTRKWWLWFTRFPTMLIVSKPSVSRLPIYVGMGLMAFWLLLLLHTVSVGPERLHGLVTESLRLVPLASKDRQGGNDAQAAPTCRPDAASMMSCSSSPSHATSQ
ncbi:hypothetical protein [Ralstonia sp. Ralssp135]|uniref:RipA family octameric membrane protein n=1 Tax=Ralstonia sp. Ralssp135 TaxID=3243016 RepID=UPI0039B0C915